MKRANARNPEKATLLFVCNSALSILKREIAKQSVLETGGMLIGYKNDGQIVVTHATGPGPKAKHALFNFQRDVEYCNKLLEQHFYDSQGVFTYIGEWHTHPFGALVPSKPDDRAMRGISCTKSYQNSEPVLIIAKKAKPEIKKAAFHYVESTRSALQIIHCDDVSVVSEV